MAAQSRYRHGRFAVEVSAKERNSEESTILVKATGRRCSRSTAMVGSQPFVRAWQASEISTRYRFRRPHVVTSTGPIELAKANDDAPTARARAISATTAAFPTGRTRHRADQSNRRREMMIRAQSELGQPVPPPPPFQLSQRDNAPRQRVGCPIALPPW